MNKLLQYQQLTSYMNMGKSYMASITKCYIYCGKWYNEGIKSATKKMRKSYIAQITKSYIYCEKYYNVVSTYVSTPITNAIANAIDIAVATATAIVTDITN